MDPQTIGVISAVIGALASIVFYGLIGVGVKYLYDIRKLLRRAPGDHG